MGQTSNVVCRYAADCATHHECIDTRCVRICVCACMCVYVCVKCKIVLVPGTWYEVQVQKSKKQRETRKRCLYFIKCYITEVLFRLFQKYRPKHGAYMSHASACIKSTFYSFQRTRSLPYRTAEEVKHMSPLRVPSACLKKHVTNIM